MNTKVVGRTKQMTKAMLLTTAIAWSFVSAANAFGGPAKAPWISLRRTECYGTCPVFTLRVFGDGRFEYEGKRFVIRRGRVRAYLAPAKLEILRQAVAEANLAVLDRHCCDCRTRTDAPWTYLEIVDQTGLKSIDHYHGCSSAPKRLSVLEETIVSTAGVPKWTGSDSERSRQKWTKDSR
jgi:hypothetical protein